MERIGQHIATAVVQPVRGKLETMFASPPFFRAFPDGSPVTIAGHSISEWRRELCIRQFIEDHEITDDDFQTDHWQVMFKLAHPEVFA